MDPQRLIASLDRFRRMLPEVVRDVSPDEARWQPADGAWSILGVVCHLADEEEFDFGARLKLTLSDPNQPWPEIDPEGWARERRYNDGSLHKAAAGFTSLREQSLKWLRSLDRPD